MTGDRLLLSVGGYQGVRIVGVAEALRMVAATALFVFCLPALVAAGFPKKMLTHLFDI